MRAPLSIIIPTLNAGDTLPDCLQALMEGLDRGLIREVVVSDGGSSDATGAIAQAWGAVVLEGSPSRGGQIVRGCTVARGEWLLILHADTVLSRGWAEVAERHMTTTRAGWFRLRFATGGIAARAVAGWANLRSRLGLPYGDQGLLLPADLLRRAGGYPDLPLMEDVAVARALRGSLQPLDAYAVTSAVQYERDGWLRRGARNLWTLLRYLGGADPQRLAVAYRRDR